MIYVTHEMGFTRGKPGADCSFIIQLYTILELQPDPVFLEKLV
jgi:hypothetical protein